MEELDEVYVFVRVFMKSRKWRAIIWTLVLLLTALYAAQVTGALSFVSSLHNKIAILIWVVLTWYALLLSWRAGEGKLRTGLCLTGMLIALLGTLLALLFLLGGSRRAVEYIGSPNGRNTAVVTRSSFMDDIYLVYPLRAKVFVVSNESVWLSKGERPDASRFIWVDEDTLQFEDMLGETQIVRF